MLAVATPAHRLVADPVTELVIGVEQYPAGLNPATVRHQALDLLMGMTRRPLAAYDSNWNIVCLLCTRFPSLENGGVRHVEGPDGTIRAVADLELPAGAKWGDGVALTTEDIVFSIELRRTRESGISDLKLLDDYIIHDRRRFSILFDANACVSDVVLDDLHILPAHLEGEAARDPARYKSRSLYETDPTRPGLYFGPYRIVEVVPPRRIVLERNPHWWGRRPAFDKITFRFFSGTAALEAAVLAGEIDYSAGEVALTVGQALHFQRNHGEKYDIVYQPGLLYEHIAINLDHPVLSDVRVRRALLLATDRERINRELFGGRQPLAHSHVHPLDPVFHPGVPRYGFDLARAGFLLAEAGWTPGPGGIRHNRRGEPLRLELTTTAGNGAREQVQRLLRDMWRAAGVELVLKTEPASRLFSTATTARGFSDMAMFAWVSTPGNIPFEVLHSSQVPGPANNFSGQNVYGFRHPEMDRILEAQTATCVREERQRLSWRQQELYATVLPGLPLYFRSLPYIMPKWLLGVRPTGHIYPGTLWVEHWHIDPETFPAREAIEVLSSDNNQVRYPD